MQEPTKKRHTDNEVITLRLKVHRNNAAKIKDFARGIEAGEERTYSVEEVFPDLVGKEKVIPLRTYRNREDMTQRQLAQKVGIPRRHISEMENGKRPIGKEMAKCFGQVLAVDYRALL